MLTIPPIAASLVNGGCDQGLMTTWAANRRSREKSMAAAEGQTFLPQAWHDMVLEALKLNDIRLITYVPDRVLTTLIRNIHADPFFTAFATAREEEAVGI